MTVLPEPTPTAPAAGQAHLNDQAAKLLAAVEDAMRTPTSYRDDSPVPRIGTTAPVQQPGAPAMSQRATDTSRLIMHTSLATVPPGLIAIGVMLASEHADATVIGLICAAPAAVAVPILAIARLLRRAGQVAPAEIHNHYNAPVDQQTTHTSTRGVWAKTNNRK